jgi:uncharacterized protein (TIGR03083 family)
MSELIEPVGQVWRTMRELLVSLRPEDWERPTPCEDWRVKDLVAHVSGGASGLAGLEQPSAPPGFTPSHEGINAMGDLVVAARAAWAPQQLVDEFTKATDIQLQRFRSMSEDDWESSSLGPPGVRNLRQLVYVGLLDSFTHVLDLRAATGRPLEPETMPDALDLCIARAIELTPWGAVKRAFLEDNFRTRLELSGAHGMTRDLVVEDGRGAFLDPDPRTTDVVSGTTLAYLFVVTGRAEWAELGGGIEARGEMARALLERFVIWADTKPQRDKVANLQAHP